MKKHLLLMLLACLCGISASAEYCEVNGIYYYLNGSEATVTCKSYGAASYSGSVTIPASVTYNNVTYSVISIGESAFTDCTGLTSVSIPGSVTSIGRYAFSRCSKLTSVTIPNSVTSIGKMAFWNCTGLTTVTIPYSVNSIGESAFCACSDLKAFYGKYASSDYSCLIVDGTLNSFAPSGLIRYTIPNSVTSIGNYAFTHCSGLTSVTIPNSVTSIGKSAFEYCSGLTSVTIPNSVISIGEYALDSCSGLTSLTVENDSPANIALGSSAFYNVPTSTCVLYVPKGSKELYAAADQWKAFSNIEEVDLAGLEDVEIGLSALEGEGVYYDLMGRRVVNPAPGIYIRNGRKVLVK